MTTDLESTLKPLSFGRILLRSGAGFGLAGAAGFALYLLLDGDNPLRSDDPYLVGFLLGAVGAASAAIYTLFETFVRRPIIVDFVHFGLLGLWALMLLVSELFVIEGQGYPTYFAAGSVFAGTIAWPPCRFRIPTWFAVGASLLGIAMAVTYFVVASRLGAR
jgi:hypothetical protein